MCGRQDRLLHLAAERVVDDGKVFLRDSVKQRRVGYARERFVRNARNREEMRADKDVLPRENLLCDAARDA